MRHIRTVTGEVWVWAIIGATGFIVVDAVIKAWLGF